MKLLRNLFNKLLEVMRRRRYARPITRKVRPIPKPIAPAVEVAPDLGHISRKYESGNLGPGTISNPQQDPGGKSYGEFQLATRTGTLNRYIVQSKYKKELTGIGLASAKFDERWIEIAKREPEAFAEDQKAFIVKTHYKPAETAAKKLGFDITNRAVQEAIFSIAVQHGGYGAIFRAAKAMGIGDALRQIGALYGARTNYVNKLKSLPLKLKGVLAKRYESEKKDVSALV